MSVSTPTRSDEEILANETFEALMWALSRPGHIKTLSGLTEVRLIEALIDRECRVHSADPLLLPAIMRSGAQVAELDQADHVFLGALQRADVLRHLCLGSDLYPDDGATVILRASFGSGPQLRLTGPGVNGALTVQIDGVPANFWDMRAHVMRYPTGFELILLDGDHLLALPRSTTVEVL